MAGQCGPSNTVASGGGPSRRRGEDGAGQKRGRAGPGGGQRTEAEPGASLTEGRNPQQGSGVRNDSWRGLGSLV